MKKTFLLLAVMFSSLVFCQDKKTKINQLINLNGTALTADARTMFIQEFKNKYPEVPEKEWTKISNEINLNKLVDSIGNIYDKHFTEKEIDQLLNFYKTEVGKKMVVKLPIIMQEFQLLGRDWGLQTMQQINETLKKDGYLKSPPPPMPSK